MSRDASARKAVDLGEPVSEVTTSRLSVYLRCLDALYDAKVRTVSSRDLAQRFHLNAAQIRKDLARFGEFGVRGVGYYVADLRDHLRHILGLDRHMHVAIMGAGNLGTALADYGGFRKEGFQIVALFDIVRDKIGNRSRTGVPIHDVRDFRRLRKRLHVEIAVMAVPPEAAQSVLDMVVDAGVKAVLNFCPGALNVPRGVRVKSVDLTVSLEGLSFFLAQEDKWKAADGKA